eukprot:1192398-Prorocentrum_minimum.AAC.3
MSNTLFGAPNDIVHSKSAPHPSMQLIVLLWIIGGVAGASVHTNDMLKPLDGLRMSGWVAEGAGCILGGGAENIGGWMRGSES